MYYVYILKLRGKRRFYIGITSNLKRRLREHSLGRVKSTCNIYNCLLDSEEYKDKKKAWKKEKWLKSGVGREWIKNKYFSL